MWVQRSRVLLNWGSPSIAINVDNHHAHTHTHTHTDTQSHTQTVTHRPSGDIRIRMRKGTSRVVGRSRLKDGHVYEDYELSSTKYQPSYTARKECVEIEASCIKSQIGSVNKMLILGKDYNKPTIYLFMINIEVINDTI